MGAVEVRQARLEEIIDLRNREIIAGTDRDSPYFEGDTLESTRHFGAFWDGRCVGCATFLMSEYAEGAAWQLRGMATEETLRGRGVGRRLLRAAEDTLERETGLGRFWCNARVGAAAFYEKEGWRMESEVFAIKGVGDHMRMVKGV